MPNLPTLGSGLGYRHELHADILSNSAKIDWLEIIADQFLPLSGAKRELLDEIQSLFRCASHSVNASLGGADPLDMDYLQALRDIAEFINAPWSSDHFCFTAEHGVDLGHLAPVPWTRELATRTSERARAAQAVLNRPLLLENITYHFVLEQQGLTEAQFICEVLEHSDCLMLLDVSNVYTNSVNHHFDPYGFLDSIPMERVVQMHIAGGQWFGEWLEDSHDSTVPEPVWDLARYASERASIKGTLIERDADFPGDFSVLLDEVTRARALVRKERRTAAHELLP